MKKIIAICFAVFVAMPVFADTDTDTFRAALVACDNARTDAATNATTTDDVNRAVLDASNCYIHVGNDVIAKFYSDSEKDMRKELLDFSNALYAAAGALYSGPDLCYPDCGQIANNLQMTKTEDTIKQYVSDMLDYIDTLNF